jgi:hypothetical protein
MTDRGDHTQPSTGTPPAATLRRRGMLAAVAALAAGGLAKATATPALAGTDGDLVLNTINTGTSRTTLQATTTLSVDALLVVDGTPSTASGYVDAIYAFAHGISG